MAQLSLLRTLPRGHLPPPFPSKSDTAGTAAVSSCRAAADAAELLLLCLSSFETLSAVIDLQAVPQTGASSHCQWARTLMSNPLAADLGQDRPQRPGVHNSGVQPRQHARALGGGRAHGRRQGPFTPAAPRRGGAAVRPGEPAHNCSGAAPRSMVHGSMRRMCQHLQRVIGINETTVHNDPLT